ncbi:MAG: hypothetical protein HZB39_11520 [Planctomycetes bacterium]|nr:hypothetical protein [Planctomycetota bacterium]
MLATLTLTGWIFMLASTLSVATVTIWCFAKVLTEPGEPPEPHIGLGP